MTNYATDLLVSVVCGGFVAFYAMQRYNTPATNRHSTTQSLFLLTGTGYVLASVGLFVILSEIALKPGVLSFLGLDNAQEVVAKYAAPPLLAAAILTALLPNVPVLTAWDKWILSQFQTWGSIPQGVRNLADIVERSQLAMTAADQAKLSGWISNAGDIPNELSDRLSANAIDTVEGDFTRTLWLYRELQQLEALATYAPAFRARHDRWQAIKTDFQVFTAQSQAFFVLFDQLTGVQANAGQSALKYARERYHGICRELRGHLAELLAGLLLMVEGSEPRINSRLDGMGFVVVEPACAILPIGPFVFIGVMIVLAIFGFVALMQPPDSGQLPMWATALLIGTTKTIAVLAAVLPKLRWNAFRRSDNGDLPYLAWLTSAGGAALVTLVLDRAALALAQHDIAAAFGPLTPLAPTTFTMTLAICILCDVDLHLGRGWLLRISEGAICGASTVVTLLVCLRLVGLPATVEDHTPPWFIWLFPFTLGFVFGFVAPHLYRQYHAAESQPRLARMDATALNPTPP